MILTLFDGLALPVIVLLFLQWPLRDLVQAGSRTANDLGQILFALYIASAITKATRGQTHLKCDLISTRLSPTSRRRIQKAGLVLGLIPWAGFILWAGWPLILRSVIQHERFAETGTDGYFLIKAALALMACLIVIQSLLDLTAPPQHDEGPM